jgi:hypothetical protein
LVNVQINQPFRRVSLGSRGPTRPAVRTDTFVEQR